MESSVLVGALFAATFVAVVVFARMSKKKTEDRRDDPSAPKSTLAADAPNRK